MSARTDAVFCHRQQDNRPFLNVSILGEQILALLDSGANQSVLGKHGLFLIKKLGLKLTRMVRVPLLQTADGANQSVLGQVVVPLCVDGQVKEISLLVSDSISTGLTLGADCCYLFGLKANFGRNSFVVPTRIDTLKIIHSQDDLDDGQKRRLEIVVNQFKEISGPKLGRVNCVQHRIDTGDAEPVKQRYFPTSPAMLAAVNKEVDEMLELGVIRPSSSPWNSPVVMVKKKDGSLRFCFDGRRLNSVTRRDSYPLPFVSDILDRLRDARFLTSIDLKKAFWQIPLSPDSWEKTAFTIPRRGLFEFVVLPFGLHNSPQTLQRLMDNLLGPKFDNVFVYLDDIIVVSQTFDGHMETLCEVFKRLNSAGLTVNFDKCEFCKPSLSYLGFVVDQHGLRTDPDKVKAIVEYPAPRTTTEIKRFLGMAGWYRRFIPDFSSFVSPILTLLKGKGKRQSVKWDPHAEESFQHIKQLLVSAPILSSPDYSKPFIIQTDASDVGLAAVLIQGEGDDEKVIAYASRSVSSAEKNYSATEKECLAVLFGIDKYRPYVEGSKFTVVTDHYSLLWLAKLQNPSGRLARWSLRLSQHVFDIVHRKGRFNVVPDALSRAPAQISTLKVVDADREPWYLQLLNKIAAHAESYPNFKEEDGLIYKYVANKHNLVSNLIEWKLVVPKKYRSELLRECHDDPTSAHLGCFKTLQKLGEKYYWPKMKRDVSRYVRRCEVCLGSKSPTFARFGLMGKEKSVRYPFQLISVDIMGPFPRSTKGNAFLLVVSDWFTKFTLLKPVRQATSSAVVKFLENEVFLLFGVPQIVMCDNGVQFKSSVFKKLIDHYKVQKVWYNASYHPQVNPVERVNKVIGTAIRSYVKDNHRLWDVEIYRVGHALRNAVHEVTGQTPSFLNFGRTVPANGDYYGKLENLSPEELTLDKREQLVRDVNQLSEVYEAVGVRLKESYERNKGRYDLRRRAVQFERGDTVWKKNVVLSSAADKFAQKLAPKYVRCTVKERTGTATYRLVNEHGKDVGVWHVKDLRGDTSGFE